MTDVTIRVAGPRDHLGVMRVLDGANLECDASVIERRIENGMVLVADDDSRIIGALVAVPRTNGDGTDDAESDGAEIADAESDGESSETASALGAHVEAVGVRLRRRGQGIGTALMRDAADRWRPLTADFYPGLSGFYEKLDFDIEKREGQFRGVLE